MTKPNYSCLLVKFRGPVEFSKVEAPLMCKGPWPGIPQLAALSRFRGPVLSVRVPGDHSRVFTTGIISYKGWKCI